MFREGYYIEIIKTKYYAATAVITIEEKTVQTKRKKISTNKWLDLEDWSALYDILEKALAQNSKKSNEQEKKKCTKHLKIAYTFEPAEDPNTRTSLPTVRVRVSPLKKKSRHKASDVKKDDTVQLSNAKSCAEIPPLKMEEFQLTNDDMFEDSFNSKVEEYIPNVPNPVQEDSTCEEKPNLKYVPSRKSTLESFHHSTDSNEYIPTIVREKAAIMDYDALYIPNSALKNTSLYETYEPCSSATSDTAQNYIPNSKGVEKKIEEYQPDFTSKAMKFDDSYIPSSSQKIKELQKSKKKPSTSSRKSSKKDSDSKRKEPPSKRTSSMMPSSIKREI